MAPDSGTSTASSAASSEGVDCVASEVDFAPEEHATQAAARPAPQIKLQKQFTPGAVLILKVNIKFKRCRAEGAAQNS